MICSCGEALIDMVPGEDGDGAPVYRPLLGGSVFNTAVALGRLGLPSAYFGGLSRDAFGEALIEALQRAGVSSALCPRSELPTALAVVELRDGAASYHFHFAETAGLSLRPADLPALPVDVYGLHFGGISLVAEPCGSAYEALLLRESDERLISIDPNIRPGFVDDEAAYRGRLSRLLARSHLVKVSDEDLRWLAPGESPAAVAARWLDGETRLVVLTRGADGAEVFGRGFEARVPAAPVAAVVDTVGAGDTFVAGLWAGLTGAGVRSRAELESAGREAVVQAVAYAQRAAAISVGRAGADAPWQHEMEAAPGAD